jgi:hypothetical protein
MAMLTDSGRTTSSCTARIHQEIFEIQASEEVENRRGTNQRHHDVVSTMCKACIARIGAFHIPQCASLEEVRGLLESYVSYVVCFLVTVSERRNTQYCPM